MATVAHDHVIPELAFPVTISSRYGHRDGSEARGGAKRPPLISGGHTLAHHFPWVVGA